MRIAPSHIGFTVLLGICAGLPALSIDLSAPTLTILPAVLETSITMAGLTLSLFMAGFAVGQFSGGRASDRYGRRPVLLGSLSLYVFSGMCCALATSGWWLISSRFLQGIGAGACAVQASAMVQDLFRGEAAREKQSYVSVVLAVMPMLAPALGTVLLVYAGWRSVHVVLAIGGLLLGGVIALFVNESLPAEVRRAVRGIGIADCGEMLRETVFRRVAIVNALSYGAVFAYIAGAPVVVMNDLGQPPLVYAALFACTALALSSGAMSNASLARRGVSCERLVWPGLVAQSTANILLVAAGSRLEQGGIFIAIPALLVSTYARGLLSPNFVHAAVSRNRERAGLASALVGLLQLLVGAAASAWVALLLASWGYLGVAIPMAVLATAAAAVWWSTVWAERIAELRRADR